MGAPPCAGAGACGRAASPPPAAAGFARVPCRRPPAAVALLRKAVFKTPLRSAPPLGAWQEFRALRRSTSLQLDRFSLAVGQRGQALRTCPLAGVVLGCAWKGKGERSQGSLLMLTRCARSATAQSCALPLDITRMLRNTPPEPFRAASCGVHKTKGNICRVRPVAIATTRSAYTARSCLTTPELAFAVYLGSKRIEVCYSFAAVI